jgi:site-specific DNA-methyltransferase (adenine-specific)
VHETITIQDAVVHVGSNLDVLPTLADNSVDAIVTDPPYELGIMSNSWDNSGIAYNVEVWRQCLRVLKPGGYLLAFGGTRTWHRLAVAIEDAGFEIRDNIAWLYGSGFPKSHSVGKAMDKAAGATRTVVGQATTAIASGKDKIVGGEKPMFNLVGGPVTENAKAWEGWGTALKPAHEPVVLARKAVIGTIANNILTHGVGGLNIDATRIGERFPANIILDETTAELLDEQADASRFFYVAKASKRDRNEGLDDLEAKSLGIKGSGLARVCETCGVPQMTGCQCPDATYVNPGRKNFHPTVKPTALMQYLIRLVTPEGGVVLDPFAGSGSTGKAAIRERKRFIGIELTVEYLPIIEGRLRHAYETLDEKEADK